jgi:hypothetical protein
MFWNKDKNKSGPSDTGKALSIEQLRAQAMDNVRAARENIGEDILDRFAAAMAAKEKSLTEQAKARIAEQDAERVAIELLYLMDKRH